MLELLGKALIGEAGDVGESEGEESVLGCWQMAPLILAGRRRLTVLLGNGLYSTILSHSSVPSTVVIAGLMRFRGTNSGFSSFL